MIVTVLLVIAVICFVVAALEISSRINLIAVGLACFAASFLVGHL
jgi:hypothetical protein